ncbi:nucleotidyltransferase family protein [Telmatobacter bradus]|uniref:nucleotidyltransferase family protein n=1 Tax=Telmatobacter bradus TaxID=474953 RepID=UPI003B42EC03
MRPSEALRIHRETIRQLILEEGMTNPRVFGSVVRGEDTEESDLDLLVDPAPRASLLAMERLQEKIYRQTGVPVDLRTADEMNVRFRSRVLSEAMSL